MLFEGWRFKMQHGLPSMAVWILLSSVALCGQDRTPADPPASAATADESSNYDPGSDSDDGWVRAWKRIAAKARASQPHFVSPLVTTHVCWCSNSAMTCPGSRIREVRSRLT